MLAHAPVRPETKRPDIERAALHLFISRGLRGTTVRDIAARAHVAEGTLYRHWRSKRELARSVYQGCAATVAAQVRRAADGKHGASAKLSAAIRALFRSARDDILLYELLVLPPSRDTHDFLASTTSPTDVLTEIVIHGQRCGEFGEIDPRLVSECIIGAVHRVTIARRLGTLPRRLTQYERELAAVVPASLVSTARRRTAS
jgi:AcrR family transcriptional regulator